jgi:anaerobic dimethyl sulfoxide reductase subunit B
VTYAFVFDESSCTGCKACQAACKDKNNLPLGVLWRRVYEVNGGKWKQEHDAWTSNVFAYNLSIACNHCVHPKCAGVCPVDAYEVRPDGIVLIDTKRCIGCGYCAWACPYDAPQADKSAGYMTKCNLCFDNLDAGLPPACVSACPLRCLDLVDTSEKGRENKGMVLWEIPGSDHPYPLPRQSRTEPHLIINPHPAVQQVGEDTHINNREETSPAHPHVSIKDEIPLLIFTLLTQMAIGGFVTIFLINLILDNKLVAEKITIPPLLAVGVTLTVALLISLFHLGTPGNAWRAMNHLRKSWLSREILFTSGFLGLWVILMGMRLFHVGSFSVWLGFAALAAVCGIAAVFSMQRVYQLRSVPAWNTTRTMVEFAISSVGLGGLLTETLLPLDAPEGVRASIVVVCMLAFLAAGFITKTLAISEIMKLSKWRVGILVAGFLCAFILLFQPLTVGVRGMFMVLIFAMAEETIGRWIFYSRRNPGI